MGEGKTKAASTEEGGRKQQPGLLTVSALKLFPLLRKIQAMNGKKRILESMSAKQEKEKPLGRLSVQTCLGLCQMRRSGAAGDERRGKETELHRL